ncbi:MAG: hypothetical protein HY819_03030 [Acidobacteria bacterium]|nr:hypothetical protein [Acidobacteriota bacterium]
MSNFNSFSSLVVSQGKKNLPLLISLLFSIFLLNLSTINAQNPNPNQNSLLEEQLQIINNTLASYPAQNSSKYTEVNRISINSRGKLTLYKQYQINSSCTASREEVFLTDLEPTKITAFAKGSTMVITVGCKDSLGNCVQRFFRNSCDVTFKPESFQKELLIISSANLRNTEELRIAFSKLIKLADSKEQEPTNLENKEGYLKSNSDSSLFIESASKDPLSNSPLVFINPITIEKKKRTSLTMDDVEPIKKKPAKNQKSKKPKAQQNNEKTQDTEEIQDADLDKLLETFLEDK